MCEPENGRSEETTEQHKLMTAAELVDHALTIAGFVKWVIDFMN